MNYQSKEEAAFKNYLRRDLLLRKGYKRYAEALMDYYVNLTNDPSIIAAVDPKNYIIYINRDHMYDDPDTLSMLIRHELLHSFLNHTGREIRAIANEMGLDPDKLTKVDFEKILREISKPNFAYRQYNAPRSGNISGDLDLSRYYLEKDVEITKQLGGLLLEDHPEWLNLSFEEIRDAVIQEDKEIRRRAMKKVYGNFVDDETFEVDHEEDSEFSSDTISTQDLKSISIPSIEEAKIVNKEIPNLPANDFWLRDKYEEDEDRAYYFSVGRDDVSVTHLTNRLDIRPVLTVKNLDLYDKAMAGEPVKCLGMEWVWIPNTNKLFSTSSIAKMAFGDQYSSNDYKGSPIDIQLQAWFNRMKGRA